MPLLFSYGTLRDEQVQVELFGRTLVARNDELLGFREDVIRVADPDFARTSGKAEHAILRPTGALDDRIPGVALVVTDEELALIDRYEPVEYARVLTILASGARAWVFVDAATIVT